MLAVGDDEDILLEVLKFVGRIAAMYLQISPTSAWSIIHKETASIPFSKTHALLERDFAGDIQFSCWLQSK